MILEVEIYESVDAFPLIFGDYVSSTLLWLLSDTGVDFLDLSEQLVLLFSLISVDLNLAVGFGDTDLVSAPAIGDRTYTILLIVFDNFYISLDVVNDIQTVSRDLGLQTKHFIFNELG